MSQVEVVSHLLGCPTEFSNNDQWSFLNTSILYWQIFRRWYHLRRESGAEDADEPIEEMVMLGESGERIPLVQAYAHRGRILQNVSLYDEEDELYHRRYVRRPSGYRIRIAVQWRQDLGLRLTLAA